MGSKDTYKGAVKVARQNFREAVRQAWREYRHEVRKRRLLRQQVDVKVALENMGVISKQIPVIVVEGRAQKINVRREKA